MKNRRRIILLADQATSSLSNVVVTILVAGAVSPQAFGAFAGAMLACQLVTEGVRSVVGEPLLTFYSAEGPRARRRILADVLGTALFLSLACSAATVAVAQAVGDPVRPALMVLAVVLPLIVLQDAWRYLFVIDRPAAALGIDIVRLLAVLIAMSMVPDDAAISTYVFAWGVSGGIGAVIGFFLGWGLPAWPHPWRWLVEHRAVCWRFFVEFATAQGAGQAAFAGLAAIAGATALGSARAAWVIYGVLNVLHSALYVILVPEGVRLRGQPDQLQRKFVAASLGSIGMSALWMGVAMSMPASWGARLFGETWVEAERLLLPMGLAAIASAATSGGLLGLRALGDAPRSLRARILSTPLRIACPLVGAAFDDARGFVLGLLISNVMAALIWWYQFRQGSKAAAQPTTGTYDDSQAPASTSSNRSATTSVSNVASA